MTAAPTTVNAERPFLVELDAFSGPLDLLLHLIREQEIDIADIPIARIADQFLEVIESLGLNDAANYLEMAAWLLRIKIQVLLPKPFDDEQWEDPRAVLVRRLLEYEQIREVARWLEDQASVHSARFPRGWVPDPPDPEPTPIVLDIQSLMDAVQQVLDSIPEQVLHRIVPRPLDVESATKRIITMLEIRRNIVFSDLFDEEVTIADILSALVALLELARVGKVRLKQPESFGTVEISDGPTFATS